MFQIDHPTAVSSMPAPSAAANPGFFGPGDVTLGKQPTRITVDFLNIVMLELLNVLGAAGVPQDKNAFDQVAGAITILAKKALVYATPAEVALGIDGAKTVTAAALAGTKNLGPNGSYTHPGGFTEQWGVSTTPLTAAGGLLITFPVQFKNQCVGCTAVPINSNSVTGSRSGFQEVALSKVNATLFLNGDASGGFADCAGGYRWRAIGY